MPCNLGHGQPPSPVHFHVHSMHAVSAATARAHTACMQLMGYRFLAENHRHARTSEAMKGRVESSSSRNECEVEAAADTNDTQAMQQAMQQAVPHANQPQQDCMAPTACPIPWAIPQRQQMLQRQSSTQGSAYTDTGIWTWAGLSEEGQG